MADSTTKSCPVCFSAVDSRAKKCPHCHSLQGGYRFAAKLCAVAGAFAGIGLLALIFTEGGCPARHKHTDRVADVNIVSSDQYFAPSANDGKAAAIVGWLNNTGDRAIQTFDFEVRCYNKDDKLIDVFADAYFGSFEHHEETPFKITERDNIHLPEADYATHKIIIKHAYADD